MKLFATSLLIGSSLAASSIKFTDGVHNPVRITNTDGVLDLPGYVRLDQVNEVMAL